MPRSQSDAGPLFCFGVPGAARSHAVCVHARAPPERLGWDFRSTGPTPTRTTYLAGVEPAEFCDLARDGGVT